MLVIHYPLASSPPLNNQIKYGTVSGGRPEGKLHVNFVYCVFLIPLTC